MNTEVTPPHSLPAVLFRERVLDDAGKPIDDNVPDPDVWELADTREPELLELGRGQLLILATDVMGFLDSVMLHPVEDGEQTIRAIFTPGPSCPAYRMGDLLTVAVPDAGAITYQILVTHGELPDQLPLPGEMCALLRLDLCLI
ncbi:MAG: hypothetical protein HHJ17_08640 [Rhodoferax sp.]|uniref:hypothetical protein n=1 Tax=Rhodoferax sp. TaxID=50421 RepID=UPI0017E83CEE|nr:hypothetical protein [Rhodoferax sp.]NMM13588.1 hypothetical protein [Rhodoferax sp.]